MNEWNVVAEFMVVNSSWIRVHAWLQSAKITTKWLLPWQKPAVSVPGPLLPNLPLVTVQSVSSFVLTGIPLAIALLTAFSDFGEPYRHGQSLQWDMARAPMQTTWPPISLCPQQSSDSVDGLDGLDDFPVMDARVEQLLGEDEVTLTLCNRQRCAWRIRPAASPIRVQWDVSASTGKPRSSRQSALVP